MNRRIVLLLLVSFLSSLSFSALSHEVDPYTGEEFTVGDIEGYFDHAAEREEDTVDTILFIRDTPDFSKGMKMGRCEVEFLTTSLGERSFEKGQVYWITSVEFEGNSTHLVFGSVWARDWPWKIGIFCPEIDADSKLSQLEEAAGKLFVIKLSQKESL